MFLISAGIESLAIAYTWVIFSLQLAREPLEPPYNLSAFLIQFPGICLTYLMVDIYPWCSKVFYVLTYVFQWVIITLVIYGIVALKTVIKRGTSRGGLN